MSVITFSYQEREWTIDTDAITTRDLAHVERVTGEPGVTFLDHLMPTQRDGSPLRPPVVDDDGNVLDPGTPPGEMSMQVPAAVCIALWWLAQKQAGKTVPIDQVDVAYGPFLSALYDGILRPLLDRVKVEVDGDPKDETPAAPSGSSLSESTFADASPSFS